MTIVPAVLVLISGSQIIRDSADRWFSEPVDEVLSAAQVIARQVLQRTSGRDDAARAAARPDAAGVGRRRRRHRRARPSRSRTSRRRCATGWSRSIGRSPSPAGRSTSRSCSRRSPRCRRTSFMRRPIDWRRARRPRPPRRRRRRISAPAARSCARRFPCFNAEHVVVGVVVVSQFLSPEVSARARVRPRRTRAIRGCASCRRPIQGIYQSVFLAVSLLILMSATWLGLYLAKRITRPVQMLAEGARAIGAGQLDLRLEPDTGDELGSLVESFNMMAAELRTSREKLEQSRQDLEHKNLEVDARRRYIETILERVATGVISLDADGRISTVNGAAERLLGLGTTVLGRPAADVFGRDDLQPLLPLVEATRSRSRAASCVRSRSPATAGRCTWRPRPRCCPAETRPSRGRRARARRRDAAHPGAAGGGLARRRAAARARDQESADADPAQRRTAAPPLRGGAAADESARRRMHRRDHHRGRGAQGARRRVRAVRAACADRACCRPISTG